jgi:glycosyltransferase involved in cell wall biosynthesis
MKILQVCPKFHPFVASGSTIVAYDVSRELVKKGHIVTVFTSDMIDKYTRVKNGAEEVDNVKVYRFKSIGTILTREFKIFITPNMTSSIISEIRSFDIIHLHEYTTFQNIVIHHFVKKYNVPYVLQVHGSLLRVGAWRRLKWFYNSLFGYKLLKDAAKVIALSRVEAEQYKSMGVPDEKIAIIPNGIDLLNCSLPPKGVFKEKYHIPQEKKIILFLGRINRFKGIDFLIDSFVYLVNVLKYDALLVIAGPDDGYLNETIKRIQKYKIEDKVLFTGTLYGIEKMEAYVDASVVASLDSLKEVVFLLVPLEAAACGTPVIVTKTNYIAKLLEKENFGSVVEYGNVQQLAIKIKEMLSNEILLVEMGSKGRKFVSKNFHWDKIVDMFEKVYEEAIETKSML